MYRSDLQMKGLAMVPKRACYIVGCQVAKFLQLTKNAVVPVGFYIQRKVGPSVCLSVCHVHAQLYTYVHVPRRATPRPLSPSAVLPALSRPLLYLELQRLSRRLISGHQVGRGCYDCPAVDGRGQREGTCVTVTHSAVL